MSYPIDQIRNDFPILKQKIHDHPLVYLDNGATTQKPQQVIDKIAEVYSTYNSNIHRGVHRLSGLTTDAYQEARSIIAAFLGAANPSEIVFTGGTTDSINLVAFSFGEKFVNEGDEILISNLEHHSNIVPWQMMCQRRKAILKVTPIDNNGFIDLDAFGGLLSNRTKLVAITQVSNSMGTVQPVDEIIAMAHKKGVPVMVDGAQAVQHLKVDVRKMDVDFYSFSGHKIYGPTGTGALYGKQEWLAKLGPYQGGGDMIDTVTFDKTTYNDVPLKFEAGTPNYVGMIALGAAINYVNSIGVEAIGKHEADLLQYARTRLAEIEGIRIFGSALNTAGVVSFLLKDVHYYDTGMILDKLGIAVRTGSHCTQPLMERLGITGTVRASFGMYNTKSEIDLLINGLERVKQIFG